MLRDAGPDVQRQVIEEGFFTGGNPSACLVSRIIRIKRSGRGRVMRDDRPPL